MFYCAICDDDAFFLDLINPKIKECFAKHNISCKISVYTSPEYLLRDIKNGMNYDVLFLDIEMPEMSGMVLANKIKSINPYNIIVFLTSHTEYAIDSFELDIFRFIPKIDFEKKIYKCIEDAISKLELQKNMSYTVVKKNIVTKLAYKQIMYIKKDGKYSCIYCTGGIVAKVRKPLKELFGELNQDEFIFVERGYIVNLAQISKIDGLDIYLFEGEKIPASRLLLNKIKEKLALYWGERFVL